MIIKKDKDSIQSYLSDASNYRTEICDAVYIPVTYDEVIEILKECNSSKIPVTISAGGTGLCGGRVPDGGILISTEKLNKIIRIEHEEKKVIVQCGVVLQNLQDELKDFKLFYPPDPTEKSCFVGGTVATNASGARTFKYGATRNWVEKLKVILSNGEMLELKRGNSIAVSSKLELITSSGNKIQIMIPEMKMPNVKNAAGYFLKKNMDAIDLFIGSEGTLGLIVEAELKLLPMPNDLISCVAFFDSFDDVINFVEEVKFNSLISETSITKARAIEFLDNKALNFLKPHFPRIPESKFAIWFEQELYYENKEVLFEEWIKLLDKHNCSIDDTWYALNEKEINEIKEFRHAAPTRVNEYIAQNNFRKVGTDTAVESCMLKAFYKFCVEHCNAEKIDFVTYGHIGNDHLHLNMLPKDENEYSIAKNLYREFCMKAIDFGGTVSAEHGIGKLKREYFKLMYNEDTIRKMFSIKKALDPNLILGRGNIFEENFYKSL